MNNQLIFTYGLGVCIVVALMVVGVMWIGGVVLTIRARRRKEDSFITQELKRIDSKGAKK